MTASQNDMILAALETGRELTQPGSAAAGSERGPGQLAVSVARGIYEQRRAKS